MLLNSNYEGGKTKGQIQIEQRQCQRTRLESLHEKMKDAEKRQNEVNMGLTTLPLKEWGYDLNKKEFWDAIRICYNGNFERLPIDCVCGEKFYIAYEISCEKKEV